MKSRSLNGKNVPSGSSTVDSGVKFSKASENNRMKSANPEYST